MRTLRVVFAGKRFAPHLFRVGLLDFYTESHSPVLLPTPHPPLTTPLHCDPPLPPRSSLSSRTAFQTSTSVALLLQSPSGRDSSKWMICIFGPSHVSHYLIKWTPQCLQCSSFGLLPVSTTDVLRRCGGGRSENM